MKKNCCRNCKHWKYAGAEANPSSNLSYGECDVFVEVPSIYYRASYIDAEDGENCPFFEPLDKSVGGALGDASGGALLTSQSGGG